MNKFGRRNVIVPPFRGRRPPPNQASQLTTTKDTTELKQMLKDTLHEIKKKLER